MKKLFSFNTKTLVATGLGAALFTLLFMFVKIPTGIPNTEIQTAYGMALSSRLSSDPLRAS